MIILLCGRDQCGLNAHSIESDSMRIESWSSVDRPLVMDPLLIKLQQSGIGLSVNNFSTGCFLHADDIRTLHQHHLFGRTVVNTP